MEYRFDSLEDAEPVMDDLTDKACDRHATQAQREQAGQELMDLIMSVTLTAVEYIDANGGPHTLPSMELMDSWRHTGMRTIYDQLRSYYKLTD